MKVFFSVFAILYLQNIYAQDSSTRYFFKEIGMYMTVPNDYQPITTEEHNKIKDRGENLIEKANDIEVDASSTKDLLSVRKGKYDYLNVTATSYRQVEKNGWEKTNKEVKNIVFHSLEEGMKGATLDSVSTKIRIDGISFDKFEITVSMDSKPLMKMVLISKFYKGYDFGIAFVSLSPQTYAELNKMVMTATFDHLKSSARPGDPAPRKNINGQ